MKYSSERDRRQHTRFPQVIEVHARTLPPVRASHTASREVRGRIQNVSTGGLCIMSSRPLPLATFVCCEIAMADVPVSIPTFMEVRWTAKQGNKAGHYINGLRFLTS